MSMKPIYMCSTLNFGLLDNHGNPGSVGIVFLYKPGTENLNFRFCEMCGALRGDKNKAVSVCLHFLQSLKMGRIGRVRRDNKNRGANEVKKQKKRR